MLSASAELSPPALPPNAPASTREVAPKNRGTMARLARHPLARLGALIIFAVLLIAIFAPVLSRLDPNVTQPNGLSAVGEPHPPGAGFPLGADDSGRDVWTRTLYGARISLIVGFCAMLTSVCIGTPIGLVGGYFGGWIDRVLMRLTEVVLSLPTVLLALALIAVLRSSKPLHILWFTVPDRNLFNLLLAISLVTWTGIARIVRGQVLALKEREFIEAARAVGASHGRIIWRHLLPNVLPTIIVIATLATANNILLEAGLSYLGLGVERGTPSWGGMIADGQKYILAAPWMILPPGIAIALTVAGFYFLGQAMQEVLEPRA